jgi:hypothetical protein
MFSLFITHAGLIIGLGAVTVIDCLGFLGRKSSYWTQTTIRSHKVTKPLIWLGTFLYGAGLILSEKYTDLQILLLAILIINGLFLSFYVSKKLLKLEAQKKDKKLLPKSLQIKIIISFLISFSSWWTSVYLLLKSYQ